MFRHAFRRLIFLVIFCALSVILHLGWGQTQSINGNVRGRVADAAGAAVPNAQVSVKNDSTGFERMGSTDGEGYYVLPNLPLGTYTLTIQKEGFAAQRRPGIVLNAGAEVMIDAQLAVGAVTTMVEVSGGTP